MARRRATGAGTGRPPDAPAHAHWRTASRMREIFWFDLFLILVCSSRASYVFIGSLITYIERVKYIQGNLFWELK
ncbi:hypothetical protein EVAR_55817_1 [Eumeta japonica]|uniref:Uncharacterized protein n=1 Tax=Eumeta variegata TaxID=151549 RepID=A0A4C1ZBN9_EUMVA|nr:hypothetical protein EVAR_55817_1 [Eumeta japonica]